MDRIPNRLAQLREEQGWSQDELAERLGIDQGRVSRYEQGVLEIPLDVLGVLCRIYKIRPVDVWVDRKASTPA